MLYTRGAVSDPTVISHSSSSMDVFFGKNNGNLVHLAWSRSTNTWNTEDWTAGMTGRPIALTRNGGDMSIYYRESNNYIAERAWDWQTGWSVYDWTAHLAGSPSVVTVLGATLTSSTGKLVATSLTGT